MVTILVAGWKLIERLEPGGHRLFLHEPSGRLAIADNSGSDPGNTDTGILWLDCSRPVKIVLGKGNERLTASVPVIEEGGQGRWVSMTTVGAYSLQAATECLKHPVTVKIDQDNPQLAALLQLSLGDKAWQRTIVQAISVKISLEDTEDHRT